MMNSPPHTASWVARVPSLVLAIVIASMLCTYLFALPVNPDGSFRVAFDMTSTSAGTVQLFYDTGPGFTEAQSIKEPIGPSAAPRPVSLAIPSGVYRALRVDPNVLPGRYVLSNFRIEDPTGRVVYRPDRASITGAGGADVAVEGGSIIVHAEGTHDPWVVITPDGSLVLTVTRMGTPLAAAVFLLGFALSFGLFSVLDARLPSRGRWAVRVRGWASQHASATVVIACCLAAVVATYPLLLGRSLVTPANTGLPMLYDHPPFVPGASDFVLEDTRGSDTGSVMWGLIPYSKIQREAVAAGEWPLWNRYNGLGRPLWGSGLATFLDPLHLVSLLVEDPAAGWDLKFFYGRLIFTIGVGLLAHAATGSALAAIAVGTAAPFFGYFTYRLNHPAYFSILYVPWLLWAFTGLCRAVSIHRIAGWAVLVAAFAALQLFASTPKEGVIAFIVAFGTGALAVLFSQREHRTRRIVATFYGGLVGLLLSAPHWLVFLDTLSRAWTVYDAPQIRFWSWPLTPAIVLGASTPAQPLPSVNMIVAVGVLLSIATIHRWWRSPMGAACALSSAAAMAIAAGAVPAEWLLRVPLVRNVLHIDYSFTAAAVVPLTVVAAFGFRDISRICLTPRAAALFAIASIVLGLSLFANLRTDLLGHAAMYPAAWAITGAVLVPFAIAAYKAQVASRFTLAAVVAAAGLVLLPGGLHVDTGLPLFDNVLTQPRLRADLDVESPATEAAKAVNDEPFRAVGVQGILFPGTQALWELEGLVGADALELPHFRELGSAAGMFNHPWIWVSLFSLEDMQQQARLLDMFGVRAVFARTEIQASFGRRIQTAVPDSVQLIERATAWPRAFFSTGVLRYSDPADMVRLLNMHEGPFAATQRGDEAAEELVKDLPLETGRTIAAEQYQLTTNSTAFTVHTEERGIAVLGEAYDARDFRAFVNGERVPYFRVNHMYKAVVLPGRGTWRVQFVYVPAMWTIAWTLAAVGGIAACAAVLFWRRRAPAR